MTATWNEAIASGTTAFSDFGWLSFLLEAFTQRATVWEAGGFLGGAVIALPTVNTALAAPPAPVLGQAATGGSIGPMANPGTPPTLAPAAGGSIGAVTVSVSYTYLYETLGQPGETLPSPAATQAFTTGTTNAVSVTVPALPTGAYAVRYYASTGGTKYLAGISTGTTLTINAVAISGSTPPITNSLKVFVVYTWDYSPFGFPPSSASPVPDETNASPEASVIITTGQTNVVTITLPGGGGPGANVYVGTVSGSEFFYANTATVGSFNITSLPIPPAVPYPRFNTTATDVQSAGFWEAFQEPIVNNMIGYLGVNNGPWLDVTGPLVSGAPVPWTELTLRTHAGLTNGVFRAGTPSNANFWRRCKPREITDQTQTGLDTDGNTLVAGQVAWVNSTPLSSGPLLMTYVGKVADPVAAPTVTPSTMDGTLTGGSVYIQFTWTTPGGETLASLGTTATVPVGPTGSVLVTAPALPTNATGIKVYASATSGGEILVGQSPTNTFTIKSLPATGAVPPTANTTPWQPTPNANGPNILDSNNALATNDHTDPGIIAAGDYIGPWILLELRAYLNALVWFIDFNCLQNLLVPTIVTGDQSLLALTTTADVYVQYTSSGPYTFWQTIGPGAGPLSIAAPAGAVNALAIVKYDGTGGFAETLASP